MKVYDKINLTMLCDFYELTMAYGYFEKGVRNIEQDAFLNLHKGIIWFSCWSKTTYRKS